MTTPPLPLRIVILGGGTAGWMTASLMAHRWRDGRTRITVVESPDIGIIGVGEGSTPQLKSFFDSLGIDEAAWMGRCNATYKNGISFHGWSDAPGFERYFHPFPGPLDAHTAPAFYYNAHFRRQGVDLHAHPDRFFPAAHLAARRLAPLPPETFPFEIGYGYHFDATLVGAFLREHAVASGVRHMQATIERVDVSPDGNVAAVVASDGRRFDGDFFVDCSGFRSAILQEALGVPFRPFAENLFNDSAIALPSPPIEGGLSAETEAVAMRFGWRWRIPLTNRFGNGYVYSSRYCSADDAELELRTALGLLQADAPARRLQMKVGRVERHWEANCLAVGLSQGFIEPLEATALHLVQATVEGFIDAFDQGGRTPVRRDAFNADINARFEGVRDYIVCHYKANKRHDTEYWRDAARLEALSDPLRAMLACWITGGDIRAEIARLDIGRYYSSLSWHCLLGGYGVYPDAPRPAPRGVEHFDMARIDDFVRRCALNFPDHRDALAARANVAPHIGGRF